MATAGSKVGVTELSAAYDVESRLHDKRMDFLGYYVYRPLSFPMTVPFVRMGMSANQVTYVRITVVVIALALLCMGGYSMRLTAAWLLLAHLFLDLIDGNLARLAGPSNFGGFLDEITDILLKVLTPVALATGLYFVPDGVMHVRIEDYPRWTVLIVGLVTGLAGCIKAYIAAELKGHVDPAPPPAKGSHDEAPEAALRRPPEIGIGYIYRTGVSLLIPAIPVFAWFDSMSIYLVVILLSRTLTLPVEIASALRRARSSLG